MSLKNSMNTYNIIRIADAPHMLAPAAKWFHEKWGVPESAYRDSMTDSLRAENPVPQWYIAIECERIIGGMGVIENDFHDRKDLSPNICAVYTEPDCRGKGIAGRLLEYVCADMAAKGVSTLYLLTDHIGFYERYGWKFLCMAQGDGDAEMSRVYIHHTDHVI